MIFVVAKDPTEIAEWVKARGLPRGSIKPVWHHADIRNQSGGIVFLPGARFNPAYQTALNNVRTEKSRLIAIEVTVVDHNTLPEPVAGAEN